MAHEKEDDMAKRAEAPIKEAPEKFEARDANYRHPKRPTRASFEKRKTAVVMLVWSTLYGDQLTDIADRDYQHVSATKMHDVNGKDMSEADIYFMAQDMWAREDWDKFKDLRHATVMVTCTDPDNLQFGKMEIRGGSIKWRAAIRADLNAHPEIIFSSSKRERIAEDGKVKGQRKRTGQEAPKAAPAKRRKTAAIEAGQKKSITNDIQPKRRVRKRAAAAPGKGK
jgi:hypothetical protein